MWPQREGRNAPLGGDLVVFGALGGERDEAAGVGGDRFGHALAAAEAGGDEVKMSRR